MYLIQNEQDIDKRIKVIKKQVRQEPSNMIPKFIVQDVLYHTQIHDIPSDPVQGWQLTHHLIYRTLWIIKALDAATVFADVPVKTAGDKRLLGIYKKEYNTAREVAIELCKKLMSNIENSKERYNDTPRLQQHQTTIQAKYSELRQRYSITVLWHIEEYYTREKVAHTLIYYVPLPEMPWMLLEEDYDLWAEFVTAWEAMLCVIGIVMFRFRGIDVHIKVS